MTTTNITGSLPEGYTELQRQLIAEEAARVAGELGLSINDKGNWEYEKRVQYNKRIARFILDNPSFFSGETQSFARDVQQRDFDSLEDTGFDWRLFGTEILNESEKVNPFSPQNRMETLIVLGLSLSVGLFLFKQYATGKA